jgi:hypothetical protein
MAGGVHWFQLGYVCVRVCVGPCVCLGGEPIVDWSVDGWVY